MGQFKGCGTKVVDGAREPEGRLSELCSLKELAGISNRNFLKAEENLSYFKCPFFMKPQRGNGRKLDTRESEQHGHRKKRKKKSAPQELHDECPHWVSSFNSNHPAFI